MMPRSFPLALAAAVLLTGAAKPAPARPLDVRWGECLEGTSIRLAKAWTYAGEQVCAIRGAYGHPPFYELRWPAFSGTFAGVPGCTLRPFYVVDPLDFHGPTRREYGYALRAVRIEPPGVPAGEVAQLLLRLTRGLAPRFGPPTGVYHDDGMPLSLAPTFASLRAALRSPMTARVPAPAAQAVARQAFRVFVEWRMPGTDDIVRLDTAAEHPVRGVRGPLTVLVTVASLAGYDGGPEAMFAHAGLPMWEALDWNKLVTEEDGYAFYRQRVPYHMPGEPLHGRGEFVRPSDWP